MGSLSHKQMKMGKLIFLTLMESLSILPSRFIKHGTRSTERRSLVIIRPTVIFGEGNRGNVYNLFRQIADRRFLMFGDGENKKSMAYVGNVAEFICHLLERMLFSYI